ncbi:DNA/RNA non-specific endonuclease [Dickeya oryzae]|nr:DNA/RNA non-specific endonuclease [Dickeya oryzae]MBP2851796.1 DNA/RNA non-specific endonuclease [Dickeya oryzae]
MAELQAGYSQRIDELSEKLRANGSLSGEDLQEWAYLHVVSPALEASRLQAIHNAQMAGGSDEASQLAINSLAQAGVAGAAGVVKGSQKSGASTQEKEPIALEQGGKGAWNKALNKPEPNEVYSDGAKTFYTDDLGRTNKVEASLEWSTSDRNTYQQRKAGKSGEDADEGGHLIASIFNGPGEKINLVPMDGNLNKGAWKQMENLWANVLKDGGKVQVKIEPSYSGESIRPDAFTVTYQINNERPVRETFNNAPGGK